MKCALATYKVPRLSNHSTAERSFFSVLQGLQEGTTFPGREVPPWLSGMIWSIVAVSGESFV